MATPIIHFGAGRHREHAPVAPLQPLMLAYQRLHSRLSGPVSVAIPPEQARPARNLIDSLVATDGMPTEWIYDEDEETITLARVMIRQNHEFDYPDTLRLPTFNRFGWHLLAGKSSASFGPFFSTPAHQQPQWTTYFQQIIRWYDTPYITLQQHTVYNHWAPFEPGIVYTITRHI